MLNFDLETRPCFHWRLRRITASLIFCFALPVLGCGIKTDVKVPISPMIAAARTATLQDLLALLQGQADSIISLSSTSIKITLTAGKAESGKLEQYRGAPGYVLLKRPTAIRLNIQNPLTKTTIIELLSVGDQFEIWSPRDNKVYAGRNSVKEFELEETSQLSAFSARPIHILDAILSQPLSLSLPDRRIMVTEEQDAQAKYYVLTLGQETGSLQIRALRRLWIERSQMAVAKEETFTEAGQVASIVRYSSLSKYENVMLPGLIRIERPLDGYILDLQFRNWRVNPDIPESAFILKPPSGAERIVLKEKGRS